MAVKRVVMALVLAAWAGTSMAIAVGAAAAADDVPARLDAAKAAWARGDLPRTARELDAVLTQVHERLGRAFAETMPPPPPGWTAEKPEVQGLGQVGGGLSVSRAYTHNESTLNASLILDSPAVEAAAALLANPAATAAQPNVKRVKVGADEALMRYDPITRSGEITLVLGTRVLLEIEGDGLSAADVLVEGAKGWNTARIRSLAGP
ncbi:hypothetical protein [Magnetospirillum sp. UT-4]|uniref:hypothetical protein n=1 Tax=Magnetospirillum sp. UT-4 TaxID=2681467 RepID=UPI0013809FB8|nr:hypothetical protein [Magnetospirillum sp. UT-4]CAA7614203.1 conserved exported hypothetical protein [Magnetospirillum sp. UT-4]